MGTFVTWQPTRISTTPATRPQQTGILHKALFKGLSPNLGQTKTQTPAITILENENTKCTYCFLSGPRPPRVNLPCCHWTQGISSWKADVLQTNYKFPHSGCSVFDLSNSINNQARLSGLTLWPGANPDLTRCHLITNTSVALAGRGIFLHTLRAIPTKCLPILTPLGTTGLTPCPVHCLMHTS